MSLRLIKFEPKLGLVLLVALAILCLAGGWFFVRWNFANAISSRLDLKRPESRQVVDWLIGIGPSDPRTHYAAASLLERTFDPDDLTRALREYELTAALSPYNYVMWVNLGRVRSLNGDPVGAEAALKRALELAPNYAGVQWAYGNLLIRQGKAEEGFKLVAKAAESNEEYSRSAAIIALQIFDGDVAQVRGAIGDTEVTNAALVSTLAGQGRFEEAVEAWSKLPGENRTEKIKKLGEDLTARLLSAKKFRLAVRLTGDLQTNGVDKPAIEKISNGGFEAPIKLRGAGAFEWQIAEGAEPQIGQSNTQKRSGGFGLFLLFNSFETAAFRTVSQTVAVEPGREYEFDGFYRSDLKTTATLKIEIADAATTGTIASSPLPLAGDWTAIGVKFTVPTTSEGIIIRLAREGCNSPACRVTGKLSFDDLSIRRL